MPGVDSLSQKFRLIVLGDGVAGAMSAAYLARVLPRDTHEIVVIPTEGADDSLGPYGPIEATSPSIRQFHAELGLSNDFLARNADASFSLGMAYSGWSENHQTYFLPYGDQGAPMDSVPFHQLLARLRSVRPEVRLGDYSVATLMAQTGRFALPSDNPSSPLSGFSFGFHVDRAKYARLLHKIACALGARVVESPLRGVELDAAGQVNAATLLDGRSISGDFFVDATGPAAVGSNAVQQSAFEPWDQYFHCDRTIELSVAADAGPSPYGHAAVMPHGWRRTIPTLGRTGETYFYCSSDLSRNAAEDALLKVIAATGAVSDLTHSELKPGRRVEAWTRNCVAIGAAACVLEPLCSCSLMMVENALRRLVRLFPGRDGSRVEAREFNRESNQELDRTRDFILARYVLNGRCGEPFWERAKRVPQPLELRAKLAAYRSRGLVPLVDGDLFDRSEWTALLDEQGIRPERHDLLADAFTPDQIEVFLLRIRTLLTKAIAPLPAHQGYLDSVRNETMS